MRVYTSAADHINFHPFKVWVSSNYNPQMPGIYQSGELEPLYVNPTPAHPVISMLPIANLIDLHITQQAFRVHEDLDVIRIFHSLDSYLLEIADSIPVNPAIRIYAEKVLDFRKVAFKNFARMLNHHPEWKQAYSSGTEPLLKLLDLFNTPNNMRTRLLDPIEALRDPPITIGDQKPNAAKQPAIVNTSVLPVPYHYA